MPPTKIVYQTCKALIRKKQTFKWDSCRRLWPLLWWDWPRSLSLGLRLEGSIYLPHTSLWLCCLNYLPFTLCSTIWSYLTYTLSRCIQNVSDLEMIEINSIIAPDKHLEKGWYFFLFLDENICCGTYKKCPKEGTSNEYHNICFHREIRKIICGYPFHENRPIQIYWKFYNHKKKFFR